MCSNRTSTLIDCTYFVRHITITSRQSYITTPFSYTQAACNFAGDAYLSISNHLVADNLTRTKITLYLLLGFSFSSIRVCVYIHQGHPVWHYYTFHRLRGKYTHFVQDIYITQRVGVCIWMCHFVAKKVFFFTTRLYVCWRSVEKHTCLLSIEFEC